MAAGNVLVVEDDANIAGLLRMYLEAEGFRVLQETTGEIALARLDQQPVRLIILDIGLKGELDGLELCRRIRATSSVPVLFVTARDAELDRVVGFAIGADDYVTKPFSPRELVARVHAILRRTDGEASGSTAAPATRHIGEIEVDLNRREARLSGSVIELANREFALLVYFADHRGSALTRDQLLNGVWGEDWYGDARTVDVHVRQLRKKFGAALPLTTVRGMGYRLD